MARSTAGCPNAFCRECTAARSVSGAGSTGVLPCTSATNGWTSRSFKQHRRNRPQFVTEPASAPNIVLLFSRDSVVRVRLIAGGSSVLRRSLRSQLRRFGFGHLLEATPCRLDHHDIRPQNRPAEPTISTRHDDRTFYLALTAVVNAPERKLWAMEREDRRPGLSNLRLPVPSRLTVHTYRSFLAESTPRYAPVCDRTALPFSRKTTVLVCRLGLA
jgi:hypothetical protein